MKRLLPETPAHLLEGFNNLTKSLRTNLYFIHPGSDDFSRSLQLRYQAASLEVMLKEIAVRIEAVVLASSRQDYEPWGASALMLLSDAGPGAVHMHLNKSHLCAHTYPDFGTAEDLPCLRVDLDLTSCGTISPLRSLNFILDFLQPTAAVIDYSVRGFTRDATGQVLFQDHPLTRLCDAVDSQWHEVFEISDEIGPFDQTWQMKMLRRELPPQVSRQIRGIMQLR
ncbi:MAG TPA: S-adenosylmethionine decarboxylase [Oligoflexus sp.]|uniref:S-adenosylmethionine decarboxylase n=1 Tax=Oligoflexus sp. TaxID=1971216 RepID=UPI002D467B2E|nr:S-adenosylmethionine decarboxylase [Oligoflexus sp.]HYX35142.1 S-adenosylmethionine decarboxylase [Oligoflexus sp.]